MSDSKFRLALCQVMTRSEKEETLLQAEQMVREASLGGASVVVLPEMYFCPYSAKYFIPFSEPENGETVKRMSQWAQNYNVVLIGGSIPEMDDGELYNTCFVFDQNGKIIAKHRKVHMFDVDIEGGIRFKESDSFTAGEDICVFDTDYGRFGVAICFDIRFPEFIRSMARKGAELILLPAQFNMTTGPAHWELSIRARAIDNEVWFAACSAARNPDGPYKCWGHSTVAGPFGDVRATCDEAEQVLFCDIDLNDVDSVRKQLPTFLHLREEIYKVTD